jgi:hypothetical protein
MRVFIQSLLLLAILSVAKTVHSQARIVFNGAYIHIENGAQVVVDNSNSNAVTRLAAGGHFISENEDNIVKWNLGSPGGSSITYAVPFGRTAADYIPLTITMRNGTGDGYFEFATYGRPDWENVNYLPTGVTNFSGFGDSVAPFDNNSRYTIDRFWRIAARNYTQNPDFQDMEFGYIDQEWQQGLNVMQENRMWVQRYNPVLDSWYDYIPGDGIATVDNIANRLGIGAVPDDEIFDWWTLVDQISPLPVTLLSFTAEPENNDKVLLNWETTSEQNSEAFIVERSRDAVNWEYVLTKKAAGNSNSPIQYNDIDYAPYSGLSYYRLKMLDFGGAYEYSRIVPVFIEADGAVATMAFPNPTTDIVFLQAKGDLKGDFYIAVFDVKGRLMLTRNVTSQDLLGSVPLSLGKYAQGTYFVQIQGREMPTQAFKLIKL